MWLSIPNASAISLRARRRVSCRLVWVKAGNAFGDDGWYAGTRCRAHRTPPALGGSEPQTFRMLASTETGCHTPRTICLDTHIRHCWGPISHAGLKPGAGTAEAG